MSRDHEGIFLCQIRSNNRTKSFSKWLWSYKNSRNEILSIFLVISFLKVINYLIRFYHLWQCRYRYKTNWWAHQAQSKKYKLRLVLKLEWKIGFSYHKQGEYNKDQTYHNYASLVHMPRKKIYEGTSDSVKKWRNDTSNPNKHIWISVCLQLDWNHGYYILHTHHYG